MPSDSTESSAANGKLPLWRISMGLLVLLAIAGYFVIPLWTETSKVAVRQLADVNNSGSRSPKLQSSQGQGKAAQHKFSNHLIHETSPYLLQHAHNPVNWYPWGPEALAKAKKEDKPIFLSVGYSTCYWCHVMEKQSFETEEVAKILNEHYIAIKVDREERPDIDEQYMLATQLVTGRGGWPNSLWLTPDGKPWMAGTYFPKARFMEMLEQLAGYWKNRRKDVEQQAEDYAQAIRRNANSAAASNAGPDAGLADQTLVDRAVSGYKRAFDAQRGGFRSRPKFPPHGILRVLLHEYRRTGTASTLQMITRTLDGMFLGGMHDHLGGGFHRYSTDNEWLLPHFEKMLYDNAQLMRAYTDAYVLSSVVRYREAVEGIFRWLQSEMTSEKGVFFSAMDSGEVGKEGETYVWPYQEVVEVLGKDDARLFVEIYNLKENGNFLDEASGQESATNIIHLQKPLAEIANARGEATGSFKARMLQMREKLLARRNTWVQPHKDDKVLTSWNGLMIGALASAGRQLNEQKYTVAAATAADFILKHLVDQQKRLLRSYRSGKAKIPGYLDDYSYLAEGLLELYAATGEQHWLEEAQRLGDVMLTDFEDKKDGAFFFTSNSHEDLLMRSKSISGSGNVPSANGVAVSVLLELGRITKSEKYLLSAERAIASLAGLMRANPRAMDSGIHAVAVAIKLRAGRRLQAVDGKGADAAKKLGPVTALLFASALVVKPGDSLQLALALDVDEGWHLYGPNPTADFLLPTHVDLLPNRAFTLGKIQIPAPRKKLDSILNQVLATYEGRIWYFIPLSVDKNAEDGETTLILRIKTQACDKNRCLAPRTDDIEIKVSVAKGRTQASPRHTAVFKNMLVPEHK